MRKIFVGFFILVVGLMIAVVIYANQADGFLEKSDIDSSTHYQIVYLVHETIPADSPLAAGNQLTQLTGAIPATSWQRVLEIASQRSIDALIIHQSAYELIDFSWTAAASRRGVVIAVINMHLPEIAEIVDSDCLRQASTQHINPFAELEAYYYVDVGLVLTDDPTEQIRAEEAVYHRCSRDPAIQSQVHGISYATHRPLTNEGEIIAFSHVLELYIEAVYDLRQRFQNRDLPPDVNS